MKQECKPKLISFMQMTEDVEYKNINTFDDQIYKKINQQLVTKSKFSNYKWSGSSASRTRKYFYRATEGKGKIR